MEQDERNFDDDDGRVVADMSEVERTPLLIPRFNEIRKNRRDMGQPANLNREERRAMIGGALTAGLLVAGCIAIGFAALILLILHVWG